MCDLLISGPSHAFAALEGEGLVRRLFLQSLPGLTFFATPLSISPRKAIHARYMVCVIRVASGVKDGKVRRGLDVLLFQDQLSGHFVVQYVL